MSSKQETPEDKQLRYVEYLGWQRAGKPIEELAAKYEFGSPAVLYHILRQDGFPVCETCGAYSRDDAHCEKPMDEQQRKVRTVGEAIELPPAKEAKPLFREALETLERLVETRPKPRVRPLNFMEYEIIDEGLDTLHESLQGEFFVTAWVEALDRNDPSNHYQEDHSAEKWEEVSKIFGLSPDEKIISERILEEGLAIIPGGAKTYPADTLVKLIGMYVLADEPLEPLVEKLHPEPEKVDMQEIKNHLYGYSVPTKRGPQKVPGMVGRLRMAATVMRGGKVRKGNKPELTGDEMWMARLIKSFDGLTRKEICKRLQALEPSLAEVNRLANLNLKLPDVETILDQHVEETRRN